MDAQGSMPTSENTEMASFRVAEFSDILDWRPMLFQEQQMAQRACVLCGVVYKKAIKLPCLHTLCTPCHAQCVHGESVCPVDQEPFSGDDVENLETSVGFILKRKVACWNTTSGCSFIGTAASLLDHYKECEFSTVPCCVCHSSVLRRNILEHFKSGCNTHPAPCEPSINPATEELHDVGKAYLEIKEAMGKISEDLMSLQTSLNRCSEDVRAESARTKGQSEAQASSLTEQLNCLNTVCTTGFAQELQVLQATTADYKEHMSKELGLLKEKLLPRHHKVHWYFKGWEDLKKRASEIGSVLYSSPTRVIHDYSVTQAIELELEEGGLYFSCYMCINPGDNDSQLEWPLRKVCTLGVIHPKDKLNVISGKTDPAKCEGYQECFQMPKGKSNEGFGHSLATVEQLEKDGFVENDALHLFLEIENP